MKAKFTALQNQNGKNFSDKELVGHKTLIAIAKGEFLVPVDVSWYMARSKSASVVYCTVRVGYGDVSVSGHGSAGGCGYHKESAAFQEALTSAGIELYKDKKTGDQYGRAFDDVRGTRAYVDGCGDRSVDLALQAIGRALKLRKIKIV